MKKSKRFIALCKKYGVEPDKVPEVLSFEAACKIIEVTPTNLPLVGKLPKRHQKRLVADYKLTIIVEAIRKKAVAEGIASKGIDYTDTMQGKYHPVFVVKADAKRPSGFGLSFYGCVRWFSDSGVGVRFSFPNWHMARFFGQHFLKLHTDHHLMT